MAASFPKLGERRTLYLHYVPGLNFPFLELFATEKEGEYFVGMFPESGDGVLWDCIGENEARTKFALWSRGPGLPENVFGPPS